MIMKKAIKSLLLLSVLTLCNCTKNIPYVQDYSHDTTSNTISLENALNSLISFFEEDSSKSSHISSGQFNVEVIGNSKISKSKESQIPDTLLYFVNFNQGKDIAILAGDRRLSETIFCVSEAGSLSAKDFSEAIDEIITQKSNSINKEAVPEDAHLNDIGEAIIPKLICGKVVGDLMINGSNSSSPIEYGNDVISSVKYGPFIKTKWHQDSPFNDLLDERNAGCTAIASAQIILFHQKPNQYDMDFSGMRCSWDILSSVCNIKSPDYSGNAEARSQAAHFVKTVAMMANLPNSDSGTCFTAEKALKSFGFNNTKISFSLWEQSLADKSIINDAIHSLCYCNPVIVCAFDPCDCNIKKMNGHTFILDGYKSNISGKFFHINWGWNGIFDGYYPCGIFDTKRRKDVDPNTDSGDSSSDNSNYSLLHWYVFCE